MTAPSSLDELPAPAEETLTRILDLLALPEGLKRKRLRADLWAHARAYGFSRWVFSKLPTVHEDALRARGLSEDITDLRHGLCKLHAQFQLPLQFALSQRTKRPGAWKQLDADLAVLEELLASLGAIQWARKQPDRVLRNAVGGLMLLIENATGNRARGRKRDSDRNVDPVLVNVEAQAIGLLFKDIDPELRTTSLVNVIEKIRSGARGKPLDEFEHQLFLGRPIIPH